MTSAGLPGRLPGAVTGDAADRMDIAFSQQILTNGLRVIVHESRALPIVAVNLWYHVGSKNEVPGRTGFAHLFEHLMFEGSAHYDHGYFRPLQEAGAALNGSTNADRTNYWELVPTAALELALWMESDRMGHLLPALTPEKFENQRSVVLNERRQNYENRPYGLAGLVLLGALYPSDHPYHWITIGSADDIRAATLEEAQAFFRTYYHPGHVSLVVAGDVESEAAVALVDRYFGDIPAGPLAEPVRREAGLAGEVRLMFEDRVELPRLYLAYHSPALFADGDADLDLVADLLSNGKSSRLYRSLVYERRIATDIGAVQSSREMSGWFQVTATAARGHGLGEILQAVQEEIDRLLDSGPTLQEVGRGQAQVETQFLGHLQSLGGFGGKSDQLNAYATYLGNPGFLAEDLRRYRRATPETLLTAARSVLGTGRRVVLSVVPTGQSALAVPGSSLAEPA